MSNIWKSAKLDFSLMKPYAKTICFTIVFPIVFAVMNRSLLIGISFAMCFIAMTAGYPFSVTEKNSMERLYGILPVRKSDLVIGRYIFITIIGLTALLFSLIIQPIVLTILGETFNMFDLICTAATGIFLFSLYTIFQLPAYYKFGSIKGRVFMYIPVAGFLLTLLLITKIPLRGNTLFFAVTNSPILCLILVIALAATMYLISILMSIRILENQSNTLHHKPY